MFDWGISKLLKRCSALSVLGAPVDPTLPLAGREMHAYVAEAVRIMMRYGGSRSSFIPLLWAGLRDWEVCSAWTRGKVRVGFAYEPLRFANELNDAEQVLLAARQYREASQHNDSFRSPLLRVDRTDSPFMLCSW